MTSLGRTISCPIGVIVCVPHDDEEVKGNWYSSPTPAMPRAKAPWFEPEKKAAWLELATVLVPIALA